MHPGRDPVASDALARRYEALLGNLNFTVAWEADPASLRLTFVSSRATIVTGLPPERWLDDEHFWSRHVPPDDLPRLLDTLRRAPHLGEVGDRVDHRFRRADGQLIWFHTGAVLGDGDDGPVLHGVCTDVTPLKTAEQAALTAAQARDSVLAAVAHDLRSPLSLLQMNAELLLRTVGDEGDPRGRTVRRVAETTRRTVEHMLRIVTDLLDTHSLDAGTLRVEPRPHAVSSLLHDAVEAAKPLADAKGLALHMQLADPSVTVSCDRGRILQVFLNLLGNAIKFTDAGAITVEATVRPDEVELSVSDTGPGIDPARLERIWERGWKADQADRRGAGLGLFLTRRLIEAQGGRAWAESSPGGSAFHFTLPRTNVPPQAPAPGP